MNKSQYVYLLLITMSNFFNLRFMPLLKYGSDESFLLIIGIVLLGFVYYRRNTDLYSEPIVQQYTRFLSYVWITIGISIITCYLFWGQSLLQSFLTYRKFFSYILFVALLWVRPSEEDVINGFKYYTYTFLIIAFCVWVLHLPMTHAIYKPSADIAQNNANLGTTLIAFYFYHLLMRLRESYSWNDLIVASLLMAYFVINQNRSLMFPCLLFYLYTIYKAKVGFSVKAVIVVCISTVLFFNFDLIQNLLDETQAQVDDDSYVRWEAIAYFLTGLSPNFICVIFGNGMISAISNPAFWQMLFSNMWNFNDVGWFGYYAFFGLVGIVAIFNIIMRIILDKNSPTDLRMLLIHMCVPTIWALWMPDTICLFCLIIYVYLYRKVYDAKEGFD